MKLIISSILKFACWKLIIHILWGLHNICYHQSMIDVSLKYSLWSNSLCLCAFMSCVISWITVLMLYFMSNILCIFPCIIFFFISRPMCYVHSSMHILLNVKLTYESGVQHNYISFFMLEICFKEPCWIRTYSDHIWYITWLNLMILLVFISNTCIL